MKTRFLFPHRFKKLGWMILLPSLVLAVLLFNGLLSFSWLDLKVIALYNSQFLGSSEPIIGLTENNVADEMVACLLLVGTILVACSEVKEEDEYIGKLRLESLLWATYINAGLLILCILFVYGLGFYQVMVFNLFTLLLLFLIRFHVVLYRATSSLAHAE